MAPGIVNLGSASVVGPPSRSITPAFYNRDDLEPASVAACR